MSDNIENPNSRLEKLIKQIMKEKDPLRYDELCSELRLVLNERGILASMESRVGGPVRRTRNRIVH
jgi:hypothetical protein